MTRNDTQRKRSRRRHAKGRGGFPPPRNPRVVAFVEEYGGRLKDPSKIICKLVHDLIRETRKQPLTRAEPPFLPEEFAPLMGVLIEEDADQLVDGRLVEVSGQKIVRLAPDLPPGRRNFTAFHEMAHLFFVSATRARKPFLTEEESKRLKQRYFEEERLCNIGATEFLLPEPVFAKKASETSPDWQSLFELARLFGASLEATVHRFTEVYTGPLMVERWQKAEEGFYRSTLFSSSDLKHLEASGSRKAPEEPSRAVARAFTTGRQSSQVLDLFFRGSYVQFRAEALCRQAAKGSEEVLCLLAPQSTHISSDRGQLAFSL